MGRTFQEEAAVENQQEMVVALTRVTVLENLSHLSLQAR